MPLTRHSFGRRPSSDTLAGRRSSSDAIGVRNSRRACPSRSGLFVAVHKLLILTSIIYHVWCPENLSSRSLILGARCSQCRPSAAFRRRLSFVPHRSPLPHKRSRSEHGRIRELGRCRVHRADCSTRGTSCSSVQRRQQCERSVQ